MSFQGGNPIAPIFPEIATTHQKKKKKKKKKKKNWTITKKNK